MTPISQRRVSARGLRCQRGNVIVEFAILFPFLTSMLAGAFTIGMSLTKAVQCSQLCRNANVLMVRSIDLSSNANKQLLLRTGSGLGMNIAGTNTPDPNGKGTIILTKVVRVGDSACYSGITAWNGNPATCPNHGQYVIAQRIIIGNTSQWASATGTASGVVLDSKGNVSDQDIAQNSSARATGFPGIVQLNNDEFTYVSEVFADVSDLTLMNWMQAPMISVRNVS
jgi:Flp pilus assembly protein TadG